MPARCGTPPAGAPELAGVARPEVAQQFPVSVPHRFVQACQNLESRRRRCGSRPRGGLSDSRPREISLRFSRRSRRRVMSGSRVIIRSPISPQVSPSAVHPRRIRSTLYCVGERSSVFSSCARGRESISTVRSRSTYAASSGITVPRGRAFMCPYYICLHDYCQDDDIQISGQCNRAASRTAARPAIASRDYTGRAGPPPTIV